MGKDWGEVYHVIVENSDSAPFLISMSFFKEIALKLHRC